MRLFTNMPSEKMSEEELYNYLTELSKVMLEITMRLNKLEKTLNNLRNA